MPRFVFRQKSGQAGRPVSELAEHASKLGGKVLSQTDSMAYIEGTEEMVERLVAAAPGYACSPEIRHELPKPPRVGVKKRPKA